MNKVDKRIAAFMEKTVKNRNPGESRKNALEFLDNPYSFKSFAPVLVEVTKSDLVKLHVLLFTRPKEFKFVKCLDFYGIEEVDKAKSLITLE